MKRFTILLAVSLALCGAARAQLMRGPDVKGLEKKIGRSNEDIENPKKAPKPATWQKRADLMMEVSDEERMNAVVGMDLQLFRLQYGNPVEERAETLGNTEYLVQVMPRVQFYFQNNKLEAYRVVTPVLPGALAKALEALNRAYELEQKESRRQDIRKAMLKLRGSFISEAVNASKLLDYKGAAEHFGYALDISSRPELEIVDTLIYYNQGIMLLYDKQYERAMEAFKRAEQLGYLQDGAIYCTIYEAANAAGQKDEALALLEQKIEQYPHQKCLALNLVNHYLSLGEKPLKVMPYLDQAIQNDPTNASLYFVRGVVQGQLEDIPGAKASYERAIELDPKYGDAYYNLAAMYYNQAVSLTNKALEITKQSEYDAIEQQIKELFHQCIPVGERLLEVDPNHAQMLDLLKSVYFRYRMEPGMKEKHEEVVKRLEALGQ